MNLFNLESQSGDIYFDTIKSEMLKDHSGRYAYRFMMDLGMVFEADKMLKILYDENISYEGVLIGFLDVSKSGNLSKMYFVTTYGIYYVEYTLTKKKCDLEYWFDKKNKCIVPEGAWGEPIKCGDDVGSGMFASVFKAVLECFENCEKPKASNNMQKLEAEDYDD